MLANINGHGPKSQAHGGSESQAVMAELVTLRTILLNVLYKQANGESLTAEEMQGLIERAATTTAAIRLSRTSSTDNCKVRIFRTRGYALRKTLKRKARKGA